MHRDPAIIKIIPEERPNITVDTPPIQLVQNHLPTEGVERVLNVEGQEKADVIMGPGEFGKPSNLGGRLHGANTAAKTILIFMEWIPAELGFQDLLHNVLPYLA